MMNTSVFTIFLWHETVLVSSASGQELLTSTARFVVTPLLHDNHASKTSRSTMASELLLTNWFHEVRLILSFGHEAANVIDVMMFILTHSFTSWLAFMDCFEVVTVPVASTVNEFFAVVGVHVVEVSREVSETFSCHWPLCANRGNLSSRCWKLNGWFNHFKLVMVGINSVVCNRDDDSFGSTDCHAFLKGIKIVLVPLTTAINEWKAGFSGGVVVKLFKGSSTESSFWFQFTKVCKNLGENKRGKQGLIIETCKRKPKSLRILELMIFEREWQALGIHRTRVEEEWEGDHSNANHSMAAMSKGKEIDEQEFETWWLLLLVVQGEGMCYT